MSTRCPQCGLFNPQTATRCDCDRVLAAPVNEDDLIRRSVPHEQRWAWRALTASAVLVVVAEGLHWLALWNLAPLGLGAAAIRSLLRPERRRVVRRAAIGALVGLIAAVGGFHILWMFDIAGTKTGSSTAGLMLLFLPFCAVLLAGLCAALAACATWIGSRMR